MKTWKRLGASLLVFALVLGLVMPQSASAAKKKTVKLNKKKVTLTVGKKVKLKLKNNKKKVKWSSNKKKVATVSKKGVVKAKKKGTAKITAKVGKKKYVCKVKVKKKKANSGNNGSGGNSGNNSNKVTGTPGKNIPITGDVFKIGSRNLALGLKKSEVNTILGSLSIDVKRTEGSPQGFDVIAFRPNGNKSGATASQKWGTYILIYLKNNKVAGICAIAKSMSYAGLISAGTSADTLEQDSKWSRVGWYDTRGSKLGAGAYAASTSNANVLAFVDYYGDNTTYCIQVFSNEYSVEAMTDPSSGQMNFGYSSSVTSAIKTESGEMLNAYLAFYGERTLAINTKVGNAAQLYCNDLIGRQVTDSSMAGRGQDKVLGSLNSVGIDCGAWGEHVLIGSIDAIGFVNSIVQSEEARGRIHNENFRVMGLGAGAVNDGAYYYPILVIDFIDFIRTI